MSRRSIRFYFAVLGLVAMLVVPSGGVSGTSHEGEVTFRLTLEGPVSQDDGFVIDVRCDGGDFCNGMDQQRTVYFCAHPIIVDTVVCEAKSFEFTVAIPPQRIEYHLYRTPNIDDPDHEPSVVLSGTSDVHDGRQVISLGYVYPGGPPTPAPALPDTAMRVP